MEKADYRAKALAHMIKMQDDAKTNKSQYVKKYKYLKSSKLEDFDDAWNNLKEIIEQATIQGSRDITQVVDL